MPAYDGAPVRDPIDLEENFQPPQDQSRAATGPALPGWDPCDDPKFASFQRLYRRARTQEPFSNRMLTALGKMLRDECYDHVVFVSKFPVPRRKTARAFKLTLNTAKREVVLFVFPSKTATKRTDPYLYIADRRPVSAEDLDHLLSLAYDLLLNLVKQRLEKRMRAGER